MTEITAEIRESAVSVLRQNRLMTLATVRSDGWPQATVVSYVNDGLVLYCFVSRMSQKFLNIERDTRVPVAIGSDFTQPEKIMGISFAAHATVVEEHAEYLKISAQFLERFPEYASWPRPNPAFAPLMRLRPEIISVIDYGRGFGHSDLVKVSRNDTSLRIESRRQSWLANILGG